jgi:hypothetical protein
MLQLWVIISISHDERLVMPQPATIIQKQPTLTPNPKASGGAIAAYIVACIVHAVGLFGLILFNGLGAMMSDDCLGQASCGDEYGRFLLFHIILLAVSYFALFIIFRQVKSHYIRALAIALLPVANAIVYIVNL